MEAKNEMEGMVLMDLAEICKKLAGHPTATEKLRGQARQLVDEFNVLLPFRGKGTTVQHFEGEHLLIRMARFLPSVLD
jgi:hypothetical protein